jgi:hypothetical protein
MPPPVPPSRETMPRKKLNRKKSGPKPTKDRSRLVSEAGG